MKQSAVVHYTVVWAALMALLLATWIVAQIALGPFNVVAAISVAVVKMLLVILFFMHVRHSSSLIWVFAGAGFVWLLLLLALTLGDYLTRQAG